MELEDARAFLRDNHRAVLHTYRRDGTPQLSPVTVAVDGDGYAIVSTRERSVKVTNLERDPSVSLCVFPDAFFGAWVRIDGTTDVVRVPDALELLVDYYRRIAGEHDDWDAYRHAMREERRVLLRITITDAGPDVSG